MRFRSFFGYPPTTYNIIQAQGSTSGLGDLSVYCNEIVIDVDIDSEVDTVRQGLLAQGIFFMEYSANRGRHFHIPIYPVVGTDVVHSIKTYLLSWLRADQIDMSMIHPAGQIRLAGSVHEKSGKIKTLLRTVEGPRLQLVHKIKPVREVRDSSGVEDMIMRDWANGEYTRMIQRGQMAGGRYPYLFKCVKLGMDAGISGRVIHRDALTWNNKCIPPHSVNYIERCLDKIMRHK